MIAFLISAIKIIVLLGFLIFIHELGHFIVAKLCNIKVNEFAIGFGPTIIKKQGKETKYALRLIPLGGFVSMEGEDAKSDDERSFEKASIPKRIAICIAGATVNILFAIIVYFILMAGTGVYTSNEIESTIEGYTAEQIGLQEGDKIIQINDTKINNQKDISTAIEKYQEQEITLKIERDQNDIEYTTKASKVPTKITGIYLSEDGKIYAIEKDSPAEKAGLKTNDKITKINNQEIEGNSEKVVEIINQENIEEISLTVERNGAEITVNLIPDTVYTYYLGVNLKKAEDTFINRCIYGEMQTQSFLASTLDSLKQLFTGKLGIDQMIGPVGISKAVAKTSGWYEFIYMLAVISLSLGVTNLLPIPALDGGKILILIIEAIRRKPISEKVEINIQLIGFSIIIALSLYVTYNDVLRLF